MVNVVEIENLFDVDFHNDLDMNSMKTKEDKDMDLRFQIKFLWNKKIDFLHWQLLECFISSPILEQINCKQSYV